MIAPAGPAEQIAVTVFPLLAPVRVLFDSGCVSLTPTGAELGAANPPKNCAFRLLTSVGLEMENGAVPTVTVETICWLKVLLPEKVLLLPALIGRTMVKSWPVTPVAVIEYLYVPGGA